MKYLLLSTQKPEFILQKAKIRFLSTVYLRRLLILTRGRQSASILMQSPFNSFFLEIHDFQILIYLLLIRLFQYFYQTRHE